MNGSDIDAEYSQFVESLSLRKEGDAVHTLSLEGRFSWKLLE